MQILTCALTVGLALALSGVAQANVWMDENFDGASVFVQGNGDLGGVAGATLDTFDNDAPPITAGMEVSAHLTTTGTVDATKFYSGTKSYKLTAGQTLACATGYKNPTNGNYQYFQFAVNVDPIPAAAGTVGTFRWNFDSDTGVAPDVDYSYYIKLVADGSGNVNIVAGEDVHNTPTPVETTIGQLTSASSWTYLTLQMQKDPSVGGMNDPRMGTTYKIVKGMHFYSPTASTSIGFGEGGGYLGSAFNSKDWAFTVETGNTIYIDDVYWDGGMDDSGVYTNSGLTQFNPATVADWTLF